jgi:TolA-binding protein
LIYVDNGRVDEYATWVRTLDFVAVTDAELDNDTYQGAENNFNKTTPSKAIAGFNGYINQFPRGIHALQANYYLAQLHYAEGAESKSIPNYEYVIAQSRSEFTEQSLLRLAQIS